MICEKCKKKEAQVYYTENVNGRETKMALCHECASDMKQAAGFDTDLFGEFFGSGLGGLMGSMFAPHKQSASLAEVKRCDLCGMSFSDIATAGKAGCPRCYDTFADELERTVARIHGGTRHTGSMPESRKGELTDADRIKELRVKIAKAVEAEDYETAATLRDEIKKIEIGGEENDGTQQI